MVLNPFILLQEPRHPLISVSKVIHSIKMCHETETGQSELCFLNQFFNQLSIMKDGRRVLGLNYIAREKPCFMNDLNFDTDAK